MGIWTNQLLARPLQLASLLLLLFAAAVLGATQIYFEDGMRQIFKADHPAYTAFQNFAEQVPQTDQDILILAKSAQPFSARQLQILRDFTLDGQLIEGVILTSSVFSQQKQNAEGDIVNIISENLDNDALISKQLTEANPDSFGGVSFINTAHTAMLIHFSVDERLTDLERARPVLADMKSMMERAEADGGPQMAMTGIAVMRHHIVDNLASEQLMLNMVGGILGSLISLLLFRSIWIGALNGVAPTFALFFTLGSFGFFGISMNVVTNAVTVLILVLAMADSIHMTHELRRKLSDGQDIQTALRGMLVEIGPPSILTSLTTMIAFASLLYSQSALINGFALAGLMGLAATLAALFIVHPLTYLFAWRFAPVRNAFQKKPVERRRSPLIRDGWIKRVIAWRRIVVCTAALLVIFLLVRVIPIETDHRFREYLNDSDPAVQTLFAIEEISGPTQAIYLPLTAKNAATDLLTPETLSELFAAHKAASSAFPRHGVISLNTVRDMLSSQSKDGEPAYLRDFLDRAPQPVKDALVGRSGNMFVLTLMTGDDHSANIASQSQELWATVNRLEFEHLEAERPTGLLSMSAEMSDVMIRELVTSFLIAASLCCLLIGLWFRQLRYGVAAIIPNLLPILLVAAFLIISDHKIQFTSAIALTIAFGVAVDDTIHLLNRYHLMRDDCRLIENRIICAVRHVAPALIITSCVLSAGLSSSLYSSMPTVIFFGILCICIFFLALLADLLLLPPALAFFEKPSLR